MLQNGVLTPGRKLSLSSTNRAGLQNCNYQIVYAVLQPNADAPGILLNPQRGAADPTLIYVPVDGSEQQLGAMITLPGIQSVFRLDPDTTAVFDSPTPASEVDWTPTETKCLLGDILDASLYMAPASVVAPPPPPPQPVAPVPPPPPVEQYTDYSSCFPKGRVFKIDSPEPQYTQYLNIAFQAVSVNPKGVLGRAQDGSEYAGNLVFFPFTEGFNPELDPIGSFAFTSSVTEQSEVYIPGRTETVVYNDFWVDPYWDFGVAFGPIILF